LSSSDYRLSTDQGGKSLDFRGVRGIFMPLVDELPQDGTA